MPRNGASSSPCRRGSGDKARASLARVLAQGIAVDVRTTVDPSLLHEAEIARLAADLASLGVREHRWQAFRPIG